MLDLLRTNRHGRVWEIEFWSRYSSASDDDRFGGAIIVLAEGGAVGEEQDCRARQQGSARDGQGRVACHLSPKKEQDAGYLPAHFPTPAAIQEVCHLLEIFSIRGRIRL